LPRDQGTKPRARRIADRRREREVTIEAPVTDLDAEFSSPGVTALPWTDAEEQLQKADVFWLSTVRPEGRPHVVPLIAVWLNGSLYFATGDGERKAKNLAKNRQVSITTGSNDLNQGLDIVVEGQARAVTDDAKLRRVVETYVAKYGEGWRLPIGDVLFFEVTPSKVFGFGRKAGRVGPPAGRGEMFNQTRWRFQARPAAR
jgi:nitroimidazol reductase NimA-like FMN-containing flavoprotein (pyridoxamine 5'-phosphate oxidase superfamily)